MPFCTACGHEVGNTDVFCATCGARQRPTVTPPPPPPPGPSPDVLNRISDRNAAILCYIPVIGWIPAIVFLASARFRHDHTVRFHAFQGLYLFVAYLLIEWVVSPFLRFGPGWGPQRAVIGVMHLILWVAWIFMLVKTSQQENFHLPIVGELAEKSVAEQM